MGAALSARRPCLLAGALLGAPGGAGRHLGGFGAELLQQAELPECRASCTRRESTAELRPDLQSLQQGRVADRAQGLDLLGVLSVLCRVAALVEAPQRTPHASVDAPLHGAPEERAELRSEPGLRRGVAVALALRLVSFDEGAEAAHGSCALCHKPSPIQRSGAERAARVHERPHELRRGLPWRLSCVVEELGVVVVRVCLPPEVGGATRVPLLPHDEAGGLRVRGDALELRAQRRDEGLAACRLRGGDADG
mmetsp:Transcript_32408/g.73874  ORF Transcript_32408/g.73874 Transcript_32408/m.73874 type:complete len:252 (+) Transcript_32408:449-1204(+)